nr:MAG TPA: hypothetical protein [Caudoviricetes sp.]
MPYIVTSLSSIMLLSYIMYLRRLYRTSYLELFEIYHIITMILQTLIIIICYLGISRSHNNNDAVIFCKNNCV